MEDKYTEKVSNLMAAHPLALLFGQTDKNLNGLYFYQPE